MTKLVGHVCPLLIFVLLTSSACKVDDKRDEPLRARIRGLIEYRDTEYQAHPPVFVPRSRTGLREILRDSSLYTALFDSVMTGMATELNQGMQFIAVESDSLRLMSQEGKAAVLKALERYGVEVRQVSREDLWKGLTGRGISLWLDELRIISEQEVLVTGWKACSPDGGRGFECILVSKDHVWRVEKLKPAGIS